MDGLSRAVFLFPTQDNDQAVSSLLTETALYLTISHWSILKDSKTGFSSFPVQNLVPELMEIKKDFTEISIVNFHNFLPQQTTTIDAIVSERNPYILKPACSPHLQ